MAGMDDFADINRRLESLIRYGTVAEVQAKPPRVRVRVGKLNTEWIRWVALRAATTSDWCPPVPGEQCVLFSPSGDMETAVALMGLASDKYLLPSDNLGEWVRRFPDGATVRYNHRTGDLAITGVKTVTVQAADHLTIDCPDSRFTGDVTIDKSLAVRGDSLTHQGVNVGSDHGHTKVAGGKDISGPPA